MDFSNIINPDLIAGPVVLITLGFAAVLWIAMLGASLKLSLHLLLDETPSYIRCTLMAVLFIAINVGAFVGLHVGFGPQPWWLVSIYQLTLQAVLVMIVARCNPFAAFLSSLAHSVFSGFGTVAVVIAVVLICGPALGGLKEMGESWAQRGGKTETEANHHFTPVKLDSSGATSNPFAR